MPAIYFLDVTNRDGVQTARITLSKLQKTMVNYYLGQLGIHQSEAGFAYLRHEQAYLKANVALHAQGAMGRLVLSSWARAVPGDVTASLPVGMRHMNLSIATSDQHIMYKFRGKLDRESVILEMVEAAQLAKASGIESLGVNAEDASRTDLGYLIEFAQAAKEAGADRFRYCDTVGPDDPLRAYQRVRRLAEAIKIPIEMHCHNDLGMAVANSLSGARAALDAGVDCHINTCVNGVGERAGNADLLGCLLGCVTSPEMREYPVADPLDLSVAYKLARYVADAFNMPIPLNQVGVGDNIFAHESGIHADGALKDRHNYELFDYELIGRDKDEVVPGGRTILTGEYGGMAGFLYVMNRLNVPVPDEHYARWLLELVQYANLHNQMPLKDDELRFIAAHPAEVAQILTQTPTLSPE
ncbi:MAG TPA: homocitrate synthase [Dehalococcoidia bacterium]|nr:homocitrate synthase [Dehalococcoidia bacterium]